MKMRRGEYLAALRDARRAVLTAPDRETAIMAYREWYELKNGDIEIVKNTRRPSVQEPNFDTGWLAALEKYYG